MALYQISRIWKIRGQFVLLASLVERCRPETHTFVLPVGEITVILKDVAHIYGLPIDREVVTGWTYSCHDFLVNQSLAIFGNEPTVESSSTKQSVNVEEHDIF
ncbi:hypothetical protein AHAS_Ahas17G0134900 [Arachis hypogaea]